MNLKQMITQFSLISKTNENSFIEAIDRTNLTEQRKIRIDKITETEDYFYHEINQRKSCSKKLSKYGAVFDYIDQVLIVLSATSGGVSIILFISIVGAPVGIASAGLTLFFQSNNRKSQKINEYNKKEKQKA